MPTIEKYDAVAITRDVIDARDALGIPDSVHINGKNYPVYPPRQVVVFAQPADLHVFVVDKWIEVSTDSPEGHIIPTGSTYKPIYANAAERKTQLSPLLRRRDISNLDEVWPINDGDPNMSEAYIVYRNTRVVGPLDLSEEQCLIPDGRTGKPHEEVIIFERKLASKMWGFAMLGIGPDQQHVAHWVIPASPHIGFIPRGTPPEQTAMFIKLDEGTLFANSRGAPDPDHFFTHAITQGPADIARAERHLLAATGEKKKNNINSVLLGPVDIHIPASQVLLYPETTVVLDTAAAQVVLANITNLLVKDTLRVY